MLNHIDLEDILFLDIETAPLTYSYHDLHETTRKLWDTKFKKEWLKDHKHESSSEREAVAHLTEHVKHNILKIFRGD